MSPDGQNASPPSSVHSTGEPAGAVPVATSPATAIVIGSFALTVGRWFPAHEHPAHQLAWSRTGLLSVRTTAGTWLLPPTLALWIPTGVRHATGTSGGAVMRSAYVTPARCPVTWTEPTVVSVPPLLRELIDHLAVRELPRSARARAERVVFDLLQPVSVHTVSVTEPSDPRAREVAEALTAHPADNRPLTAWGGAVGASSRTLARLFTAETGLSFGRWRERVRMRAAMLLLADGMTVEAVARRVGYASASSFVAAFHRTVGVTPRRYFP
ncbi:AraC family transcriptional regulator [Streptomyces armeniacus]|uniref:HTH-type transcriptional regulator RipA n=1 Tax=Streptomyces armeniacus TaxID=83291 RepID=A0A345XWM1_9ACTN|nr:helix-turn-helix transcriptional regulator [Streptomyces armeniacus]AXK36037.1 AraC family transcriptional regulator [Streptomyces armeniacus]